MIQIKDLCFAYKKREIFQNFNLDISKGEVVLVTGVNGVGKSTLLRLIAGALYPDKGDIQFSSQMGKNPKSKIGFISDKLSLYNSMTVEQAIKYHQSFYDINLFDETLIQHTKIDKTQKVSQLSMGQRTLFHLSLVMSYKPDILLIDEIIHSIDVYLREIFLNYLIEMISHREMTVLMVNLNFADIEGLVERVILLKNGKILVDENMIALKEKVKKIIDEKPNEGLPVLFSHSHPNWEEHYLYPFEEKHRGLVGGKLVDLNLTQIVKAFIGHEYN